MPRASCLVSHEIWNEVREETHLGLLHDTARVLVLVTRDGVTCLLSEGLLGLGLSGRSGRLNCQCHTLATCWGREGFQDERPSVMKPSGQRQGKKTHVSLALDYIGGLLEVRLLGVGLGGGGGLWQELARLWVDVKKGDGSDGIE